VVYHVTFSPDGDTLASASGDGTVRLWNFDQDNLTKRGCQWLHDYFIHHPDNLAPLTVCHTEKRLAAAAPAVIAQAEQLAQAGIFTTAVKKFEQAQKWDPSRDFDPKAKAAPALVRQGRDFAQNGKEEEARSKFKRALQLNPHVDLDPSTKEVESNVSAITQQLVAAAKVEEGKQLARDSKIDKSIQAFNKALERDPNLEISARDWGVLCWFGSLHRRAEDVMFACQKAVSLAPDNEVIRDSRGLARALTGDIQGAIDDFQFYVNRTYNEERKSQVQGWIEQLQAGDDPFTDEVLEELKN